MPGCSSDELEDGPLTLIDEDTAIGPLEPPTFTPIAHEFASRLPAFYSTFDDSIALLVAESAIDIGGGIVDGLSAVASHFESALNPEALAYLQSAEDGYRVARNKAVALQGNVPSDVQQPQFFTPLNFHVQDGAGAPVVGALVTIDADFGNGSTRSTDASGGANFGAATTGTVSYTITHAGFKIASGVVALGSNVPHVVTLEAS